MTSPPTGLPRPRAPRDAWWRETAIRQAVLRETAIAVLAFALCLLGGAVQVDGTLAPPPAAAWLIAGASCAALALRHRAPAAALAATTGCAVLVQPLGLLLSPLIMAPVAITAYAFSLAARSERRVAGALSLTSAVLLAASVPVSGGLSWQDASRMGAVAALPLVAGVLAHLMQNRRAYLAAVEERAWRAEKNREDEALRRVAEERVRIARELHDLVAHQITLANAQATVAAHLFDTRPEQTRTSLDQLVETTANALDDLRATVGLLRQSGDTGGVDGMGGVGGDPAEPAPGLSGLPGLLETFGLAGLQVSLHQDGPARTLPPSLDLTVYRIVQEALTNVTKHAATDTARVHLTWTTTHLTLTVADDGTGPRTRPTVATRSATRTTTSARPTTSTRPTASTRPTTSAGPHASTGPTTSTGPTASTRPTASTGPHASSGPTTSSGPTASTGPKRASGYGLIGMRERATAAGGRLSADRRPDGGFVVRAELPLPPVRDTKPRDPKTRDAEGDTA